MGTDDFTCSLYWSFTIHVLLHGFFSLNIATIYQYYDYNKFCVSICDMQFIMEFYNVDKS